MKIAFVTNVIYEIELETVIIKIRPIGFAWGNKFFGYADAHAKKHEAKPRCQNCRKVMDQYKCPFCGYEQK